ncbi:MAG: hypothetical protein RLZZ350_1958 [Verrucomicrobiota bacterium]|jgi:hypothetical protein
MLRKFFAAAFFTALLGAQSGFAVLTDPAPFDLSTGNYSLAQWDAANAAGTYPSNIRFQQAASGDPTLATAMTADYTNAYNLTTGTRLTGQGASGFAFINTSSGGLGAAVLALNTTGRTNIQVSWTGGLVTVNPRTYAIRLQYNLLGSAAAWTDVAGPIEYNSTGLTAGNTQAFGPTALPAECENQPVVYLRWKYYFLAGSGARSQLSVDDISVTSAAGAASVSAPVIASFAPTNLWAYPGQTATFTVATFGNPTPSLQWRSNGVALAGETNAVFNFPVTTTNLSATFTVLASNAVGIASNAATLVTTPKPQLIITEVMSSQFTNNLNGSTGNHGDWFEFSNLGNFPVNLRGFRIDDNSLSLAAAVTVTSNVMIAPGESVVFIEVTGANTPASQVADFRTWWGLQNSNALQVATYSGTGVGLAAAGDAIIVWNAAAASDADYLDRALFAGATTGTSFGYDANTATFGGLSAAGVNGAFVAPIGGDVASPGTFAASVTPPVAPMIAPPTANGGNRTFTFSTQANYHYAVQCCTSLALTNWVTLSNILAGGVTQNFTDTSASNTVRFYRVIATP